MLNFNGQGDLSIALVDLVWIGEFAENGWIAPIDKFASDASITDPNLNLKGFFPLLLDAFGSWGGKVYGLPFDNYSGLLFYNKCMLKSAGFDKPPATWDELKDVYGPKLTDKSKNQYAYALQSLRGETQSADSFMRVLWPLGGSLLDKSFHSNLLSKESQAGLQFRQDLMKYMPPGIVSWDHAEAVNAPRAGPGRDDHRMVGVLSDADRPQDLQDRRLPRRRAGACGPGRASAGARRLLARGRLAGAGEGAEGGLDLHPVGDLGRHRQAPMSRPAASRDARRSTSDPAIKAKYSFVEPMVASWQKGVPEFRPRFPAWPAISEIVAEFGSKIMLGEVSVDRGLEGDRHAHGGDPEEGRLLRRQEAAAAVKAGQAARQSPSRLHRRRADGSTRQHGLAYGRWTPFWFLAPAVFALALIGIYPTLFALVTSLRQYNLHAGPRRLPVRRPRQLRQCADRPDVLADARPHRAVLYLHVMPIEAGARPRRRAAAASDRPDDAARAGARVAGHPAGDHLRGGRPARSADLQPRFRRRQRGRWLGSASRRSTGSATRLARSSPSRRWTSGSGRRSAR